MTARQLAGYLESEELGARREALESIMGVQIVVVPGLPTDGAVLISRREDFLYPTPSRATVLTVVVMP